MSQIFQSYCVLAWSFLLYFSSRFLHYTILKVSSSHLGCKIVHVSFVCGQVLITVSSYWELVEVAASSELVSFKSVLRHRERGQVCPKSSSENLYWQSGGIKHSGNPSSCWRWGRRAVARTSKHILVFAIVHLSLNSYLSFTCSIICILSCTSFYYCCLLLNSF